MQAHGRSSPKYGRGSRQPRPAARTLPGESGVPLSLQREEVLQRWGGASRCPRQSPGRGREKLIRVARQQFSKVRRVTCDAPRASCPLKQSGEEGWARGEIGVQEGRWGAVRKSRATLDPEPWNRNQGAAAGTCKYSRYFPTFDAGTNAFIFTHRCMLAIHTQPKWKAASRCGDNYPTIT